MAERKDSTIAALLEDKPKRGRPRRRVSRQNVYVALSKREKALLELLASRLPAGLGRADLPDIAIRLLSRRFDLMRQAVADRNREIPEGITDLDSLYLLWDLVLPVDKTETKWTSIRLSPQQVIDLGRTHGILNALFGANRSQVFSLGLSLVRQFLEERMTGKRYSTLQELERWMDRIYL
jgi:hypothetical protein